MGQIAGRSFFTGRKGPVTVRMTAGGPIQCHWVAYLRTTIGCRSPHQPLGETIYQIKLVLLGFPSPHIFDSDLLFEGPAGFLIPIYSPDYLRGGVAITR